MKIALVAGGRLPIPAKGWGAIELLVWNYRNVLEKLGHTVDIYNTIWTPELVHALNHSSYDFIHLHWDLFACFFTKHLKKPYCVTSHCGGFAQYRPGGAYYPWFDALFSDLLAAPGNIVLSDTIHDLFVEQHYSGFLRVLPNPVAVPDFHFSPKGNGRAIGVGRIIQRKRQAVIATQCEGQVAVDFVGPWEQQDEPNFRSGKTCRYLGSWDREKLQKQLSDYSCLVLFSESEAAALVVTEALAAGLSIVVSEYAAANLTKEPFIQVVPDDQQHTLAQVVQQSIDDNHQYREQIRAYAQERFDYSVIVPRYLNIIEAFRREVRE